MGKLLLNIYLQCLEVVINEGQGLRQRVREEKKIKVNGLDWQYDLKIQNRWNFFGKKMIESLVVTKIF